MGKRVQITDEVRARLSRTLGMEVNADDYVVYECIALNTLPVKQKGSLFDGARVSEATLSAMAAVLQRGEGVPMQIMHVTRGLLPVGKAFWGEIHRDKAGRPELRVQFFITKNEPEVIAKLDDATVDEVSAGFLGERLTCSKCGFDYLGKDADILNVLTMTCNKDHTVGKDGVYVNVDGLAAWHELSLVGKGAAQGAKVVAQPAGQETALAASGVSGKALIIQLTASQEQSIMADPVSVNLSELTGFATQLATAQAELANAKKDLDAKGGEITALTAKVTEAEAKVAELSAKLAEEQAKKPQADTEATLSFLKEQHQKLNVALGQKDAAVPETAAELIAGINAAQAKLSTLIPVGGIGNPAVNDATRQSAATNAAFKSRK